MNKRHRNFSEPGQRSTKRHERNRPSSPQTHRHDQVDSNAPIMLPAVGSRAVSETPRFRTAVTLQDLDRVLANLPLATIANKETELLQWIFRPGSHEQFLVTREVECAEDQAKRKYLPHVSVNISEKLLRRTAQKWPDFVLNLRLFFVPTTDDKVINVAKFSCGDLFENKNTAQCECSVRIIKFFRFLMSGRINVTIGQRLLEDLRLSEPRPVSARRQMQSLDRQNEKKNVTVPATMKETCQSAIARKLVSNLPTPINYSVVVARSEIKNLLDRLQVINEQRKSAEDVICGLRELNAEGALLDFLQHLQKILAAMRGDPAPSDYDSSDLWTWLENKSARGTMYTLTFNMDLTCTCWKLLVLAEKLADSQSPLKDPTVLSAHKMTRGNKAVTTIQVRSDWKSSADAARHQAATRGLVAILVTIHKLVTALLLDVDLSPRRCLEVVVKTAQEPSAANSNLIDTTRRIVESLANSMEFHPFVSAVWLAREYCRETASILETISRINVLLETRETKTE